jgi:D-alanyl-D-alanine carboxypeptidase
MILPKGGWGGHMHGLIAMFCVCAIAATRVAHAGDALRAAQLSEIDSLVKHVMAAQHRPSVVIAISRDGQRIYRHAWGVQNVAADIPANIDTIYQYGSITKQFTAMCIFLLAQDGVIALDDRIGKYLPAFSGSPARIREMLIHTSGLADPSESVDYIRLIPPNCRPARNG